MKIIMLGCLFLIIIYYFYFNSKKKTLEVKENFIPSNSFNGEKKGYVFKNCSNGLGYYMDKMN
jgi:hypothetical protein